ncbi:MAG: AmmeMemoRadiSam system protein A [Actinomycetales bacterium]
MPPSPSTVDLPVDAGPTLLTLARAVIQARLDAIRVPEPDPGARAGASQPVSRAWRRGSWLDQPGACFVTLTLDGRLRGCIGTIVPRRALGIDVQQNALAAAFRDRRFPPLQPAEGSRLRIGVSVLSRLEPISGRSQREVGEELRPGVDGVLLEFGSHRSTFLPQVWAKIPEPSHFLVELKRKAGLDQAFWHEDIILSRYSVTEFHEQP